MAFEVHVCVCVFPLLGITFSNGLASSIHYRKIIIRLIFPPLTNVKVDEIFEAAFFFQALENRLHRSVILERREIDKVSSVFTLASFFVAELSK